MYTSLPVQPTHPINKNGQALLGVLISIAIFAILSNAVFTLVGASYNLVSYNRARITAKNIAQEKLERIRNIPYETLGTNEGVPSGTLPQEEIVTRNGLDFIVKTSIIYINDPFNGTDPSDTDYKRARVEVSWEGVAQSRRNPVILITDIAPLLAGSDTGGTLRVLVLDANGDRLGGAEVTIVANSITPNVNITQVTGSNGEISLPGFQPCSTCYEITVSKAGYSSDRTYGTGEVANPNKPHASLLEGQLTQVSFAIDTVGNLAIHSVDSRENGFTTLGNIPVRIHGNKEIGTDNSGLPVYKFDSTITTDGGGNYSLENLEWDVYQILMPATTSYDIAGSTPLLPLNLTPGDSISLTFSVKPHTTHSLLAILKDPSQNLMENVYLRLYDDSGFEEATTSGKSTDPDFGQNLFSNLSDVAPYHLEATASGFLNKTQDVYIFEYTVNEMTLTPE